MTILTAAFAWLTTHTNEANALAAMASASIALIALAMSIVSIWYTHRSLSIQRKHNKLSVRPIPRVISHNYSNLISVELINSGTGPLIIRKIIAFNDYESCSDLLSILPTPPLGITWDGYMKNLPNDVLSPDQKFTLIRISEDNPRSEKGKFLNIARVSLSNVNICIEYTDIYGDVFELYKYDCSQTSLSLGQGMARKATDEI